MHGGFVDRYLLATTIGMVLGISYALASVSRQTVAICAVVLFAVVGIGERRFWLLAEHDVAPLYSAASPGSFDEMEKFIQSGEHRDLTVVFAQDMQYLQVVYYCSASLTRRLVYLADEGRQLNYQGTDNTVKIYLGLRGFFPVQVADYTEFTTTHREFLLYTQGGDWTVVNLCREAASVEVLKMDGTQWLMLVKMKETSLH
jgi:hypothetical protein